MNKKIFQSVDFVLANGKLISGLVPVWDDISHGKLSVDEQVSVLNAKSFKQIDYIYFRRFSDGRASQVAAYIVDNSESRHCEQEFPELHRQVWLQGTTPLLYIAWPSRIDILTCARGPDFWDKEQERYQYNPAEQISLAAEISEKMRQFSAFRLADGTFWDDPSHAGLAKHEKAAHQSLIQAVVDVDKDIDGDRNPVLRRLLLLMILIKYLEDRRVFPNPRWFGRYHKGARSFFDVLRGGNPEEVNRLLNTLADKFNGDVFDLSLISEQSLTTKNLKSFADLIEARTIKKQRYLWGQFSFEHIPVEIISHLYQHFIKDGHGAVYTPPFLAALLLDHAMPYGKLTGKERILDPACGSGVFLVGAFRRLISFWRSKNSWQRPSVDILKAILRQSIYGVDLDSNAIDLTAFSLSLALCDALQPEIVWEKLRFDRLRDENLFEKDFFQLLLDTREGVSTILSEKFDIVIGNPPFESQLTGAGKKIDKAAQQQETTRGKCPDNQTAYLFLEQALTVLQPQCGKTCLIQPSIFLYNNKVEEFRNNIFRKHCINAVLDFTSVRNLYEADTKTVAISAYAKSPLNNHVVKHWTFRRTLSTKENICFELDHYDYHCVLQDEATTNPFIWRANLLGGGRLIDISKCLRNMRTLEEYIHEKNWTYGEGFISGTNGDRAPFLTGKKYLPTEALLVSGIDEAQLIDELPDTHFANPKNEKHFTPPLVLIKENQSLPVAYWDKEFISYRAKIVGIHAPVPEMKELKYLHNHLIRNRDFYRFCCALIGSQLLVGKATAILKTDIDIFPYPDNKKDISFSFWEKTIQEDVLEYMADYIRLGQNSELLQKEASSKNLKEYSNLFVKMLGSIYNNLKADEPIFLKDSGIICQPFYFGDQPAISWLDDTGEKLRKLIYYQNHKHLRTVRVFRFYDRNVMLIVKPDRLRYWIRSTAIRDADETLVDLRKQGY